MNRPADRLSRFSCLVVSAAAMCSPVGSAEAQPGSDVYVSGLQHVPLGSVSSLVANGRKLTACCLGSSGEDGVGIICDTQSGVGCDIDLTQVFHTAGAACDVVYKGWDGTIKGRLEMARAACCDDDCDGLADFSTLGATSVRWSIQSRSGEVLAEGTVAGPTCTFQASNASAPGAFNPAHWNVRTRLNELEATLKNLGILARSLSGDVTISGLASTPIEHASSVEFFPIICITSPCPGQWGNISAMEITATGLSGGTLEVSNAARVLAIQHGNAPTDIVSHQAECWGLGDAHLDESCALPAPAVCIPEERRLDVHNIGSSGNDGVEIDLSRALTLHHDGIVHRDLAARSFAVAVTATPGSVGGGGYAVEGRCCTGNVTLMKLVDDEDLATGGRLVSCDASGRGSSSCLLECLSPTGDVLGSAVVSYPLGVLVLRPSESSDATVRFTAPSDGSYTFDFSCSAVFGDPGGALCILSSGAAVVGVDSLRFSPISPTRPPELFSRCVVTGHNLASMTVSSVEYKPPQFVSGIDHAPLGTAILSQVDSSSVQVDNIGSSGNDGVEVKLNARGGGVTVDIAPLFGPLTATRKIHAIHRGWDGSAMARISLESDSAGNITETHDFTATGTSQVHWEMRGAAGQLLASDVTSDPILSWGLAATSGGGGDVDKEFSVSGASSTVMRDAHQGFIDIEMTVTGLTSSPITGVHSITVSPEPCAGLPENCPPTWTNVASILLTASDIPSYVVSDAHLRFGSMQGQINGQLGDIRCTAMGGANVGINEVLPFSTLHVSNIGSSGNDGVSVSFFENGSPPSDAECRVGLSKHASDASAGGGSRDERVAAQFISKLCQGCPPGEVVWFQAALSSDPFSNPASPTELLSFDATARGAAACTLSLRSSSGVELASVVVLPGDGVAVPVAASKMFVGQRREGFIVELGGAFDVRPPGTAPIPGVAELRVLPISPTIDGDTPFECRVTGLGLDEFTLSDVSVTIFCPADFDHNGTREVPDIFAFLSAWFAQDPRADVDGVAGIAVPDIFAFLSLWFAGC